MSLKVLGSTMSITGNGYTRGSDRKLDLRVRVVSGNRL